jgi:FdrA protein
LDPVGDVIDSIIEAKKIAEQRGDHLCVVASICGTEEDPQDMQQQIDMLMGAGVIVFKSNAKATLFCTEMLK